MVESVCGAHVVSSIYEHPLHPPTQRLLPETAGARLGVTAVSGMLGGPHCDFPGLLMHLTLSDVGTRSSYTWGVEEDNPSFINSAITEALNEIIASSAPIWNFQSKAKASTFRSLGVT